jgi:hypothetical protein
LKDFSGFQRFKKEFLVTTKTIYMPNRILTIIDGPEEGVFDQMVNFDDCSRMTWFTTKEFGDISVNCISVGVNGSMYGKGNNIEAENDKCKIQYDSLNKTGTIEILDEVYFNKICEKV